MRRTSTVTVMVVALILSTMGMAFGAVDEVTPSTNDVNRTNGWAHFNVTETRVGEVDIEFVSTRNFFSCFEYRSDGEATADPRDNFNTEIEDGLWPFLCLSDFTQELTLSAWEYVEIRMVFGAERDERFDWTRVDVVPVPGAQGLQNAKSGPAGEHANENARFNRVNAAPVPDARGLQNAKSGSAGERANENARFNQVDVAPVADAHGVQNAKSGPAGERANENARANR
jgi:hypothetical protein